MKEETVLMNDREGILFVPTCAVVVPMHFHKFKPCQSQVSFTSLETNLLYPYLYIKLHF